MFNGYNDDNDILGYNMVVNVNKVTPVSAKKFKVDYQVKYIFTNRVGDDKQEKTQVFKYMATIVKTNDTNELRYNGLKIQSLGHAKKVSESVSDKD